MQLKKRNLMSMGILALWTICGQAQQTDPRIPKGRELVTYQLPKHAMYRPDWIDFNKNGKKDVYEDPKATIEDRVEDLLNQMTVEEKTNQMVTLYGYGRVLQDDLPTSEWKNKLWKDGIGAIDEHLNGFQQWGLPPSDNPFVWPASRHAWALNEVQRFFIEETRLGIPVDFTNEGIRGVESFKATNFPTQLGMGHTWNRELIRKVGEITGREARLLGYTNVYAPILDVGRDQRWGRYEEVYGESPYLVAELGVEMAKGLQHNYQVAATAKHFVAYSNNKGGREGMARVDPQMSPREVEMIHVYPFKRVIQEAGLLGVMSSYNDYDGFPIQGSHYWLTERLRGEMGFKGYVVSDSDAVEYLHGKHGTAKDMKESVRQSVEAGLNVRCTFRSPDSYVLPLRELIQEGGLEMATIDDRVRDILRVKFLIGLFDKPYQQDLKQADIEVNSDDNQAVALQVARESLVLLKNDDTLLPLSADKIKTISVTGPNADDASYALTHYGPLAVEVTSVLEGLKQRLGADTEIRYTKGCEIVDANWPESEILPFPLTADEQAEINRAVEQAKHSDVAVVVLGGNSRTAGENKSRSSLELPGRQQQLLEAIYATGTPVVLVLIHGRPNSINWAAKHVPAILEAWYPGSQGGKAIAEVLFGDYNPGGKLTVTVPKTVGQIPMNFPAKPASQVDGGVGMGPEGKMSRVNGPLYTFGHGLSYTKFEYAELTISPKVISPKQNVQVTVRVRNVGDRDGDEVVQLYTRDVVSSVTTYEKNLRGFERVHLKKGETKELSFTLTPRDLQLYNIDHKWVVEPGDFKVMIGSGSEDIRLEDTFEVVPYEGRAISNRPSQASEGQNQINPVLDNNISTVWEGQRGDYLTFTMEDNAKPKEIFIHWKSVAEPTTFEVQVSSGGGQFLTVYKGEAHPTNDLARFPLKGDLASDVRIMLTAGRAAIAEVDIPSLKR
ncbi:glycoside hydrolase family 3 N-terminal domain-containing protein [Sphingobacterium chuzhouense]